MLQHLRQRLGLALILLLVLGACAPRVVPVTDRDGDTVTISVFAQDALYSANLHVFNATTEDERCTVLNEVDLGCVLGDLDGGTTATVIVTGVAGEVDCIAFGFSNPSLAVTSYRPYVCDHSGGI